MRAVDIIIKKRENKALTKAELQFLIQNYTSGIIPDYQMSAWAMSVFFNGMNDREITDLTLAMAASGDQLNLSKAAKIVVDKHSTGGVGDKTTISVVPIVAACGLPVGKMSGRGLGFSGGTIDKLESIPGLRLDLSPQEFTRQLHDHGLVLTGQSANFAPADGKLYALRDVTGTVDSIPLIASSVMSKKIAAGANAIVLDVKVGKGAFMKTLKSARELATIMVSIGKLSKRRVIAVLSPMDQPLGTAIGNAMELREAVELLKGIGPEDYRYHCLHLSAYMLMLGEKARTLEEGLEMAENSIRNGSAFAKLREMVLTQDGDVSVLDDLDKLPQAKYKQSVLAEKEGYIAAVDAQEFGKTSVELGAGRAKKTDKIDLSVGIKIFVKIGDKVKPGQPLFEVHANNEGKQHSAIERLKRAIKTSETPVKIPPYFYGVIGL